MTGSLRSRQRMRVRSDIYSAAIALFAARGFQAVTTEEIAAAAGVSASTYFRHVNAKEDLLLDPLLISGDAITARFSQRPPDEAVPIALSAAIAERSAEVDDAELQQWRTAILTAPELMARVSLISVQDRRQLTAIAAERMGLDAVADQRPGLIVHMLLAAAEYGFQRWLGPDSTQSLGACVESALTAVLDLRTERLQP
ncbi:TetR/AcrR family transcriptional regulator [Mycobacterium sp. NPDC050853]|uniref:TetR/AcrR family transcriptional regulator n=1 Tax=Mycobacteriaceae TaxID=1762 RepID=UPI0015DD5C86|nr:TetR family transcriptional regulator [Mycobacteroides sp. LB1]